MFYLLPLVIVIGLYARHSIFGDTFFGYYLYAYNG